MTDSKPRIGLGKQLFVLAAPLAMQNIITYSVGLADNIMVGKLGEFALSGVYVANIIQTMLHMTVAGLSAGLIVLASQYWGKKDTGSIKILTSFALKLAFCISLLLWGAVFFFPEKVLSLLTSDANVITEGVKYVRIICFTYMLFTTTNVLLASQRCVENVRIGMYLSLLTLISNVFELGPHIREVGFRARRAGCRYRYADFKGPRICGPCSIHKEIRPQAEY